MSFSMEHLDDRPRSAPTGRPAPEDVNWFPLVRAAFLAALTAFLVKLVSLGFFANRRDISLEVQFWKGFIPHLSMQTPPADFAQIVTASTMVMAVVSTVIFTVMVLRPNADKMVVWGWFMGVFVTFETLCLELLRHLLEPPVVDTTTVWRTAIPLTAGAAIAVVYSLVSREPVAAPAARSARSTTTIAGPDGARSVDTRPAAFQGAPAAPAEAAAPAAAPPAWTPPPMPPPAGVPPAPAPAPAAVPVGAAAGVSAALAAAAVPNRVVDTRRPTAVVDRDPADLPPVRTPTPRPADDVGPAPIVDTRPAAQRADAPAPPGSNGLSTRSPLASKD